MKRAYIEWDTRFKIGIPLIDKQHERLVQLTNNLYLACLDGRERAHEHFIETAKEVVNYINYHFTTEEKMMLLFEYPGYPDHRIEHQRFVKDVLAQIQSFSTQKNLAPNRFIQFLKEWILSHIAVNDKATAEYILSLKNNDKLQILFPKPA